MNKKTIVSILVISMFLLAADLCLAANEFVTLKVPKSILTRVLTEVLPVQLNTKSGALSGEITLVRMKNLHLSDQRIAFLAGLAGRNLQLASEVMGQKISMQVGNVNLDLDCKASIRFDRASQTLYIRPLIAERGSRSSGQAADLGRTVAALLNGHEFPVALDKIAPIVAKASNKTIMINSRLSDIRISRDGLLFFLTPQVITR